MKKLLFITHSSTLIGGAEDDFERLLKYFSAKNDEYIVEGLFPTGDRSAIFSSYCQRWFNYRWGVFPEVYVGIFKYLKYFAKIFFQFRDFRNFTRGNSYDAAFVNVSVLIWPIIFFRLKKIKSIIFIRETINSKMLRFIIYKTIN